MMLNTAQFEGTGGWVLKPAGYLPGQDTRTSLKRANLDLSVQLLAAQNLGPPDDTPNAYVKCELHVESRAESDKGQIPNGGKNKGGEWKRRSSVRHSRDPDFGSEVLDFKAVQQVVPELSFFRYVNLSPSSLMRWRRKLPLIGPMLSCIGDDHEILDSAVPSRSRH